MIPSMTCVPKARPKIPPCERAKDFMAYPESISVMNVLHYLARPLVLLAIILPLGSCVTQRTVTRNGQTVEQGIVVKRPLKEAVENSR